MFRQLTRAAAAATLNDAHFSHVCNLKNLAKHLIFSPQYSFSQYQLTLKVAFAGGIKLALHTHHLQHQNEPFSWPFGQRYANERLICARVFSTDHHHTRRISN